MEQTIGSGLFQVQMNFDPGWEVEHNNWLNYEHILEALHAPGIHSCRRFVLDSDPLWGDASVEGTFKWLTQYQLEDVAIMRSSGYKDKDRHPLRGKLDGPVSEDPDNPPWMRLGDDFTPWHKRIYSVNHFRHWRTIYGQVFPKEGALGRLSSSLPGNRQAIGGGMLHLAMKAEAGHEIEVAEWLDEEWLPAVLELPGFLSARRLEKDPLPESAGERAVKSQSPYDYLTVVELADVSALQGPEYVDYRMHPSKKAQQLFGKYSLARSVYRQIFPTTGALEDHSGIGDHAFINKEAVNWPSFAAKNPGWDFPASGGL